MNDFVKKYEERYPVLKALAQALQADVEAQLKRVPHIDRIYFRAKEPSHLAAKAMKKEGTMYPRPLSQIEDQVAGRVLVFFLDDVDAVVSILKKNFTVFEAEPRKPEKYDAFGYESYHCVFHIPPHFQPDGWKLLDQPPVSFEMQIRTLFMHAWAEPQHEIAYKGAGDLPSDALREFAWAAASAWGADRAFQRGLRLISGGSEVPQMPTAKAAGTTGEGR